MGEALLAPARRRAPLHPRRLRSPGGDRFSAFSLLGFYSALTPSLLQRSLHVESHAIGGAVMFELYAVATLVLLATQWLSARAAMLWGLALLIPALALLVVASDAPSLPLLLIGAAVGGAAAALGYRGSLQIVNTIAPADRPRRNGLDLPHVLLCGRVAAGGRHRTSVGGRDAGHCRCDLRHRHRRLCASGDRRRCP